MLSYLVISQKRSGTNIILSYLRSKLSIRWINGCSFFKKRNASIKSGIRKIGLVIQADHLTNDMIYNEIVNSCNDKTRVIINYREDLLLTFVSLKIAELTNNWAFKKSKTKIKLNKNEFNKFKIDFLKQRAIVKNFIIQNKLKYKLVTYEQFLSNKKLFINDIFNFFDIKKPWFIFNTYFLPKQEKRELKDIFI